MIASMILLEGKNDKIFIEWLLDKANITLGSHIECIFVNGKSNFSVCIDSIIGLYKFKAYNNNGVDFGDDNKYGINNILIIKDFDSDDNANEINDYKARAVNILLDVHYISGTSRCPQLLESLIISNSNASRLMSYKKHIGMFDPTNPLPERESDKNIFESYLKLTMGTIRYKKYDKDEPGPNRNYSSLDSIIDFEQLIKTQNIINLINKIKTL